MGLKTNIEWCDSTVNPTTGCDGCELWQILGIAPRKSCYAGVLHEARLSKSMPDLYAADFTEVRQAPGRMAEAANWSDLAGKRRPGKPWLDSMPRVIFVSDMSDALSQSVPFEYLRDEIIDNVRLGPGRRHIWMWLTKQPHRMVELYSWLLDRGIHWPENLWAGTSVTSQATTSRIKALLDVGDETTTRFVSAEPLLGDLQLKSIWFSGHDDGPCPESDPGCDAPEYDPDEGFPYCHDSCVPRARIHQLILGGESGINPRPFNVAAARRLIQQARCFGVAPFLKQLGADPIEARGYVSHGQFLGGAMKVLGVQSEWTHLNLRDKKGGDPDEWPEDLRVREMPERKAVTR